MISIPKASHTTKPPILDFDTSPQFLLNWIIISTLYQISQRPRGWARTGIRVGYTEAGSPNCTLSIRTMFNYNSPPTNRVQFWPDNLWNFSAFKIFLLLGTKYAWTCLGNGQIIASKIVSEGFMCADTISCVSTRDLFLLKIKSQFVICFSVEIPELMSCQKLQSLVRFCVGWHDQRIWAKLVVMRKSNYFLFLQPPPRTLLPIAIYSKNACLRIFERSSRATAPG